MQNTLFLFPSLNYVPYSKMGNTLSTFNDDRALNVFVHSWTQFHGLVFNCTKKPFWDFISGADVSKCSMNQKHCLLNAAILRIFEKQKSNLKEDGWETEYILAETVKVLESLLKAGAKPFQKTVEYVVTTGNAHVMFLLLKYGALRDLIEQGLDICAFIHISRPWEYAQLALLCVIFAYGNIECCKEPNCKGCQKMAFSDKPFSCHEQFKIPRCCRKHEHICLKRLFYAFLTGWGLSLTDDPTASYVKLLIFGVPGKNGLDVPLGPRPVLAIYKPLLLQRDNCKAATLTLLGILRRRINSTLPKNGRVSNVAQLITHMVWDSRPNDAWLNSTQAPDNNKKRTK